MHRTIVRKSWMTFFEASRCATILDSSVMTSLKVQLDLQIGHVGDLKRFCDSEFDRIFGFSCFTSWSTRTSIYDETNGHIWWQKCSQIQHKLHSRSSNPFSRRLKFLHFTSFDWKLSEGKHCGSVWVAIKVASCFEFQKFRSTCVSTEEFPLPVASYWKSFSLWQARWKLGWVPSTSELIQVARDYAEDLISRKDSRSLLVILY